MVREQEGYDAYVGHIARGVGMSSAGQGLGRVIGFAITVAIAQMHGGGQLGFYAAGIAVIQLSNIVSQLGLDNGVVRYVARYRTEGDTARVKGTVLQALGVSFGISVVLSAALFFGAGLLTAPFGRPFLETMFQAFSLALPFFTLMSMTLWATQGFQTVRYATLVRDVLQPLVNLVLVFVFYFLGVEILGAVAAYALSMALGAALALFYLMRVFPKLTDGEVKPLYESRALFAVSTPMIVANFTQYVNLWIAVLVLMAFASPGEVGLYNAGARTAALSTLILIAFGGIFSPIISRLHRQDLMADLSGLYKDVSRWSFTGALVFFLLTALLSRDIMAVFGEEFVAGWYVIVIIAAAQLFNSSVGPTARVLAMTGHQRLVMAATIASALTAVALNFALVPSFGLPGAAVATATALVVSNAASLYFVRRFLGFWPYGRRYARPLAAGLGGAAAVYGARLLLPGLTGLPALAVFVPLFLAVFVGLLFALGLDHSDRQFLASFREAVLRNLRLS